MQIIVNFGLTKAGISSTLHTVIRYVHCSLDGIGIFDPVFIQGAGWISFLIKHWWNWTPYIPLLYANLSIMKLEEGWGERIDIVLDTQGMEIQFCQSYWYLSPRYICIYTAQLWCLSHDTPWYKWRLHHFRSPFYKSMSHV